MKIYTFIRKTADSKEPDQSTQQVIGETDSKYMATEVDELVRTRLKTTVKSSTNSRPVVVTASKNKSIKVGTEFESSRAACRALSVSIQDLSQAYYRGDVDEDGCKIGVINDVTFKQLPKRSGV